MPDPAGLSSLLPAGVAWEAELLFPCANLGPASTPSPDHGMPVGWGISFHLSHEVTLDLPETKKVLYCPALMASHT